MADEFKLPDIGEGLAEGEDASRHEGTVLAEGVAHDHVRLHAELPEQAGRGRVINPRQLAEIRKRMEKKMAALKKA